MLSSIPVRNPGTWGKRPRTSRFARKLKGNYQFPLLATSFSPPLDHFLWLALSADVEPDHGSQLYFSRLPALQSLNLFKIPAHAVTFLLGILPNLYQASCLSTSPGVSAHAVSQSGFLPSRISRLSLEPGRLPRPSMPTWPSAWHISPSLLTNLYHLF